MNFVKKFHKRIRLPPPGVVLGGTKDWYGRKIIHYRNDKIHSFKNAAKTTHHLENVKQKLFGIEFRPEKSVNAYVYIPSRVELGRSKDWYGWKIILHRNGKIHSCKGSTLPKIRITWKKLKIKVVQNWILSKKVRERICLSSIVELGL